MRMWSLHPGLLDQKGLVACWRETLLAQKVLRGETKGYRNHPQLNRFRDTEDPLAAISAYLEGLHMEASARGYRFNADLIVMPGQEVAGIPVAQGQVEFELEFLKQKVRQRDPDWFEDKLAGCAFSAFDGNGEGGEKKLLHPVFCLVDGPRAVWEKSELG